MKKFFLPLLLGVLVCAGPTMAAGLAGDSFQPPRPWNLAQAVAYALKNNPQPHIAMQRLAAAAAAEKSAHSHMLPEVTLASEYSQTDNPMYSFGNILNQGAFDNSINFNDPGRTDDLMLKAQISYRLYDGGKIKAGVEAARARSAAAGNQLDVVRQQLAFGVVQAYHTILQAQDMVQVRNAAVDAISASVAVGRARNQAGDLLRSDLLNLELQQARAEEERIRSRHALELAERAFWNLLGIDDDQPHPLPKYDHKQAVPKTLDYSRRKELQAVDRQIDGARATLAGAQSETLPSVDTFADYQFEQGSILGESGNSWMAGIRLNYSLFDGGRSRSDIAAAQARVRELEAEKARLRLDLRLELQQAEISYQQSRERLRVTAKMVEVAMESAKLSRVRFQQGVILASDLIDTEMRLTDAQAKRAAARADNRIAIANLRRVTGTPQFPGVTAEGPTTSVDPDN